MTHTRSVLVVDDDPTHREIFVKTVNALGHTATGAASGQAALFEMRQRAFDLVLVDVNLAEISGITITREIRAASVRQPVILGLLADEDEDVFDDCIDAGMDGVISKVGSMGLLRRYLPDATGRRAQPPPAPTEPRPIW